MLVVILLILMFAQDVELSDESANFSCQFADFLLHLICACSSVRRRSKQALVQVFPVNAGLHANGVVAVVAFDRGHADRSPDDLAQAAVRLRLATAWPGLNVSMGWPGKRLMPASAHRVPCCGSGRRTTDMTASAVRSSLVRELML